MSIECYYDQCKYHCTNCEKDKEEGPFCFEKNCKATPEQIKQFEKDREAYLKKYTI